MPRVDPRVNSAVPLPLRTELLDSPRGRRFGLSTPADLATRDEAPPGRCGIVIVGGGLIGSGIGVHLRHEPSLRDRFAILDPGPRLVDRLFTAMASVDQRVMRSPYEHHLAPDGDTQLLDFARLHAADLTALEREQVAVGLTGQRTTPPADLFVAHTAHVLVGHGLPRRAFRAAVRRLTRVDDGRWQVDIADGHAVVADAVVVATGSRHRPVPELLSRGGPGGDRVVIATDQPIDVAAGEHVVIVGAGLSAGHWLYATYRAGARATWLVRDDEQYRCTDVDTAYFRTEGVSGFLRDDLPARARRLRQDWRGSLMLEMRAPLDRFAADGGLHVERGVEVVAIERRGRRVALTLSNGATTTADRVVVAVGVEPDSGLLEEHAELVDGFPRVHEPTLEVEGAPGLYVAGPMAGLALGSGARLIDGVRLAADRLLPALRARFGDAAELRARPHRPILGTRAIDVSGGRRP